MYAALRWQPPFATQQCAAARRSGDRTHAITGGPQEWREEADLFKGSLAKLLGKMQGGGGRGGGGGGGGGGEGAEEAEGVRGIELFKTITTYQLDLNVFSLRK
jgi:hypothetical protein